MNPRRRIAFLLPVAAVLAAAALLPGAAGQGPIACDAAGGLPQDPACVAGPPAADAPRAVSWSALPTASHPVPDRPNPSNTTLSAPARPVVGEPFTVVLATTLPETKPAAHGNGTLYEIALPDTYEDEADTSVAILFGGELEVLSSDPALGAPSPVGDGAHAIAGTVPATPGAEHRFEFTLLPSREGTAEIHAAGFLLADARLILDVMPGTAQGSNRAREPGAGPDPGAPAGRGIPHDTRPGGAIPGEASGAGYASRGVADPAAPAANGTMRASGGHSGSATSQSDEDIVLYGQIRYRVPDSGEQGAAHDLAVCFGIGSESYEVYPGGPCTLTNEYGFYVLGPIDRKYLSRYYDDLWMGPIIYASGGGAVVVGSDGRSCSDREIRYYLDIPNGMVRFDTALSGACRHTDRDAHRDAHVVSTIADTRAYFEEFGVDIPLVRVHWEPGKRASELWPPAASGGPLYDPSRHAIFLDGLDSPTTHDASKSRYAIQHAYAHHIHNHLVGAPEGCAHDLAANTSPGCAFAEGFARFVPHMVDDTPYLREHGNTFIDIERELREKGSNIEPLFGYGGPADGQTAMQVAAALWDVYDGPAHETHDRKRRAVDGIPVAEGAILDDVHAGAGGIISTMRDGPRSIEQFYAMWEGEAGRGSMRNVMELHRLPLGSPDDLPEFSPIADVRVDHAKGAAVPLSAAVPGGGAASLDVIRGFAGDGRGYGGAAVSDNGDGTGTLLLRPAMADVGRHTVVVRASHAGQADLASIDVTVTDPPKWAPVQADHTFDRGLADWEPYHGDADAWQVGPAGYPSSPHLVFNGTDSGYITASRGIDMTAYESANLSLSYMAHNVPEPPPELVVYASGASAPIWSWNASNTTSAGLQTATAELPDGLMYNNDLRISIYVKPFVPSPGFRIMLDDVAIAGVRNENPVIEALDDVTIEAESPAGAGADQLGEPKTDPPGLAVAHRPQGPFPLGTTEVTWTATDTATNESDSDTQRVTVRDTTPPAVTRGADYTVRAPGGTVELSANDYCPAAAKDAVSDAVLMRTTGGPAPDAAELSPAAGAISFPVGETTTVTWIAVDLSGNTGTAEQDVTVIRSDTAATQVHTTQSSAALPAAPDPLRARVTYLWAEPGAQAPGSEVSVRIAFSRPVALTAAYAGEEPGSHMPSLAMAGGGRAEYESGNGTSILTFSYMVPPGGAPDYAGAGALGGPCTVRDATDNTGANMTLPDPGQPGIPPEAAPRVVRVFSDAAAGVYGAGSIIPVHVEFSGDVDVEGTALPSVPRQVVPPAPLFCFQPGDVEICHLDLDPLLPEDPVPPPSASPLLLLEAGPQGAHAAYAGGSGTKMLSFHYAVKAGDVSPDLDYAGTGALELNGGSIKALGRGDDADLALPEPAAEPGLREGPGEVVVGTKSAARAGVFSRGPGDPTAAAARLGATAFNSISAERGYPVFVHMHEIAIPEAAEKGGHRGAEEAREALRRAHQNGGPLLYVGPASDRALHGMEEYAAEHGITMVSHSSAARSLAIAGDGIYRLDPGTGHMTRALAHMLIKGGFDAVVPVVQEDLYGVGAGSDTFSYGLLGSLRHDLEPAGVRVERAVEFRDERAAAEIAEPLEAAVTAAGGAGAGRNVAVLYVGSDAALVRLAGGVDAGSPVVERSAWFAAGGAGAGAGTGVAASPLVASDPAALRFARWTELAAVQPAVGRNNMTDFIDFATRSAAPGAAASTPAYAAYEAARVLGRALVLAGGDPREVGPHVREAAELDGGPLGRTSLDAAGDLRLPITYDAWSVSPLLSPDWRQVPGGPVSGNLTERAAPPGWQKAEGAPLRGMDTCGIILERSAFDIPGVAPGRISGTARQVVANAGTAEMPAVSVTASDWRLHRGGGADAVLPYSLTEMSVGGDRPGAAFVPMAPDSAIPAGTPAAGSVAVDFRVNLSGVTKLDADSMTQTVTYGPEC